MYILHLRISHVRLYIYEVLINYHKNFSLWKLKCQKWFKDWNPAHEPCSSLSFLLIDHHCGLTSQILSVPWGSWVSLHHMKDERLYNEKKKWLGWDSNLEPLPFYPSTITLSYLGPISSLIPIITSYSSLCHTGVYIHVHYLCNSRDLS